MTNDPVLIAYTVKDRQEGQKAIWRRIGVARIPYRRPATSPISSIPTNLKRRAARSGSSPIGSRAKRIPESSSRPSRNAFRLISSPGPTDAPHYRPKRTSEGAEDRGATRIRRPVAQGEF
jgi:hypothetical protein